MRNEISSYKQLPLNLYQIQTKFRDEVRPRFGIMRGREFTMKDAYSFHLEDSCLEETYQKMYDAYCNIFSRMGLDFRAVIADSGSIGGNHSHEFHVLAASGEDDIAFSSDSDYAANVEMAEAVAPEKAVASGAAVETKDAKGKDFNAILKSVEAEVTNAVKVVVVKAANEVDSKGEEVVSDKWVALVLRADHELNDVKAEKLPVPAFIDASAAALADFTTGAGAGGKVNINVNWSEDITGVDIRNVVAGDASPDGKGTLDIKRGIEVGHIFQLGSKYSEAMNCGVLSESGKHQTLTMGCYGIGVSRIVAAAIEQNHDKFGIKWPDPIAPFKIALLA